MDYHQKQKQQILAQVPASQEYTSSLEKLSEAVTSQAIYKEQALIVQINLNSRLQNQKSQIERHPSRKRTMLAQRIIH